jgi:excisionase family DNA binding protein
VRKKEESIYNAEKLAKFFGVTKKTIWGWCKRGKLPGFKIGKHWKVRVADLQKMIDRKVKIPKESAFPTTPKLF